MTPDDVKEWRRIVRRMPPEERREIIRKYKKRLRVLDPDALGRVITRRTES